MPRITDRLREAWEVLQGDRGLDPQAAAASPERAQQSSVHGESAAVATGNVNTSGTGISRLEEIARSGDLYQLDAALYAEVKKQITPEVQKYADEVYNGRVDRLTGVSGEDLSDHLDPNARLPWRLVEQSVHELAGEAFRERTLDADRILRQAVGARHSEFYQKSGSDTRDDDVRTYQHRETRHVIYLDPDGRFQQIDQSGAAIPTTKEEVIASYQETLASKALENDRRDWEPLDKAIGYPAADTMVPVGIKDGLETYRMIDINAESRTFGVDDKSRIYEIRRDEAPTRIGRDEVLEASGMPANFYTPLESTPGHRELQKLEAAVGMDHARDFTWKQDSQGIHSYQHDESRNHIHIDGDGRLYNQNREPISRETALQSAMPSGVSQAPAIAGPALIPERSLAIEQALPAVQEQSQSV